VNISISELTKVYKNGKQALKGLNLEIETGMFGLLGPNGAGKTSLMRILVTLMKPSNGQVSVNGLDLIKHRKEIRAITGYLPQEFSTFPKMRASEFLHYSALLAGIKNSTTRSNKVDEMLEKVGLYEARNRFANKLSGGMKRRLGIAQALIGSPKVLIVDEPTTGLDPEERIRFRNILSDHSRKEMIIVLSTHIVGDISSTCRKMVLLDKGGLVFEGAPDKLIEYAKGHAWKISIADTELDTIKDQFSIISTVPKDGGFEVDVVGDTLNGYAGTPVDPNLEHGYVYYMDYQLKK
jgi:ABC-2 type transport system ATP-binding protein